MLFVLLFWLYEFINKVASIRLTNPLFYWLHLHVVFMTKSGWHRFDVMRKRQEWFLFLTKRFNFSIRLLVW